ncbi:MAG: hypothetical protein JF585_02785 [Burkholderiales bacterium]|nr:hypothetical protein [Burkholderiales bacterium]
MTVLAHPTHLTPAEWGLANVPASNAAAAALGQAAVDAMAAGDDEAAWNVAVQTMLNWMSLGAFEDRVFDVMHRYIDSAFPRAGSDAESAVFAA